MIYDELLSLLSQGAVVVATVISTKGSVPREVGAKMLITCDRCIDTIGGGPGEAKVIAQARKVLQTGEKRRIEIDLTGSPKRQTEGVCGGWMEILLERWQGDAAIAIAQQIIIELKLGRSLTLVTPFGDGHPYLSIPCFDAQTHLISHPTLFKLETPKRFGIAHCKPKVSAIHREHTII